MIDADDPRLTAYLLGELDDDERRALEAELEGSAELRRELEAIRQGVAMLSASLEEEPCPTLTPAQRAAIDQQARQAAPTAAATGSDGGPPRRPTLALAVAATLLLAAVGISAVVALRFNNWREHTQLAQHQANETRERSALPRNEAQRDAAQAAGKRAVEDSSAGDRDFIGNFGYRPSPAAGPAPSGNAPGGMDDGAFRQRPSYPSVDLQGADAAPAEPSGEPSVRRQLYLELDSPAMPADNSAITENAEGGAGFTEHPPGQPASPGMRGAGGLEGFGGADAPAAPQSEPAEGGEVADGPVDLRMLKEIERTEQLGTPAGTANSRSDTAGEGAGRDETRGGDPAASTEPEDVAKPATAAEAAPGASGDKKTTPRRFWRRSQATPNASRLVIGDRDELPLEGMQVNVLVDGFRARVLLDLYYFNNRGQRLEGNFKLRLPNDASLYYFAFGESAYEYRPMVDQLAAKGFLAADLVRAAGLDPDGILRAREGSWTSVKEARVVPRAKAAHAYGETVRRRVDPALVEWAGAGVFNARVFPLMPSKLHRIVVGYDVTLQADGDDLLYRLDLPDDLGECLVDLNVAALPDTTAEVTPDARPFTSSGRAYYSFKNPAQPTIDVRLKNLDSVLLTGKDEAAGDFFATQFTPDLPAGEEQAGSSHAVFLVDTSLSSRPDKFNVWLDLLAALLENNRDSIDHFAVLFFNIEARWWQEGYTENTAGNVERLLADCQRLSLEGATDLRQALAEATAPAWQAEGSERPVADLFLLSDAAATWGETNVHRQSQVLERAGSPLFAYKTGLTGTATGVLEHLARQSGGAVFSIAGEQEIAKAARAHRLRPWKLVDVSLPGGSDVLVAGRPQFIYPGQPLLVTGRGTVDAQAALRVRRSGEDKTLEVALGHQLPSQLAPRIYGQVAVGQLEDLGSDVEDVAVAYARHFRVTGQACSLLMLESEADYRRFDVKPEDDAFVVRSSPSADLITQKLDALAAQLADAKATLVAWIGKLEHTPGVQFQMPTALRLVVERLPAEAFEVAPARLVCRNAERREAPKKYFQQLDSGRLEYDDVTAEAARVLDQHGAADALRTLSSLVENNPGDPVLARDVAFSAVEWGYGQQAYGLLRRVAELRPYEPQTYQALSQCLAEAGHADLAMIYYEIALGGRWHSRYQDVHQIVAVEYLHLLRRIERGDLVSRAPEYARARLDTLSRDVPVDRADLVVTMMWNTDRTDVDLHVLEPTGEECYYEHRRTRIGGWITRDVTEGFGPEMYALKNAQQGKYRIMANYFGSDANRTGVRSKVYVTIYQDFGDPKRERITKKTVTLNNREEKRELANVMIEK